MTKVRFKVFEWDWKEGPDWKVINEYVKELNAIPYFHEVDTNSDGYAVLIADTPLLPEEVELLYED